MNDNSLCAKLGNALDGVRAFALDMPKAEETMQRLLRDYPKLFASLSDRNGPIHVFPNVESRDRACRRFNPGVFEMRPISNEQAEGLCRENPAIGFAIGPPIHTAAFAAVEKMVIAAQMRSLHVIDGVRQFNIEVDQVEYHVAVGRSNQAKICVDNRLGRRPEIDLVNSRHWLAVRLALIFEAKEAATEK